MKVRNTHRESWTVFGPSYSTLTAAHAWLVPHRYAVISPTDIYSDSHTFSYTHTHFIAHSPTPTHTQPHFVYLHKNTWQYQQATIQNTRTIQTQTHPPPCHPGCILWHFAYYEQSDEKTICLHLISPGGYFIPGKPNINMLWDSLGWHSSHFQGLSLTECEQVVKSVFWSTFWPTHQNAVAPPDGSPWPPFGSGPPC